MRRIAVVGSFDTKAAPLDRLVTRLRELGEDPVTVDTSVFPSDRVCDHCATDVARAAGHDIEALRTIGRAGAVGAMADGAARVVGRLVRDESVGAVVCMGGSNASTVFSRLLPAIPVGVPKILLGTGVAGETRPIVNRSDAILIYPIVDIEGDNVILRGMIDRLAHVAVGARDAGPIRPTDDAGRSVALSMYGVTTACVAQCRALLADNGFESLVFHANGTGGRSLEDLAAQSRVSLVIDVSSSEVVDELFGGLWPAGSDRLRGAARHGVPQVDRPRRRRHDLRRPPNGRGAPLSRPAHDCPQRPRHPHPHHAGGESPARRGRGGTTRASGGARLAHGSAAGCVRARRRRWAVLRSGRDRGIRRGGFDRPSRRRCPSSRPICISTIRSSPGPWSPRRYAATARRRVAGTGTNAKSSPILETGPSSPGSAGILPAAGRRPGTVQAGTWRLCVLPRAGRPPRSRKVAGLDSGTGMTALLKGPAKGIEERARCSRICFGGNDQRDAGAQPAHRRAHGEVARQSRRHPQRALHRLRPRTRDRRSGP